MNKLSFILTILVVLILGSCKEDSVQLGKKYDTGLRGFQYEYHERGVGEPVKPGDIVFFSAQGVFDTGIKLPTIDDPENWPAIKIPEDEKSEENNNPVSVALKNCRVGDSLSLYMPVDSIIGTMPNIPPDAKELVYKIRVQKVFDERGYQQYIDSMTVAIQSRLEAGQNKVAELDGFVKQKLNEYKQGKLNMYTSESGLSLVVLEAGKGEKYVNGDMVTTDYYGFLEDGTMFDNSYSRGKPMKFKLGNKNVIPGWEEGFTYIQRQSKALLVIPPDLAYGQEQVGTIPPGSTLYFYVETQK